MDTTQKPQKKAVTPTPEELQSLNKDIEEVLKKHSMVFQNTLKIGIMGITPELRVFKLVDETPKIEVPKTPIVTQSEVDKKAVN